MEYENQYKKIEKYVMELFHTLEDPTLVFHNMKHTQQVVTRTKEIAAHYNVGERDMFILYAAAWFHDTGHLITEPKKHEDMSVEIMKKYMNEHNVDDEVTEQIAQCILATKAPRNPTNLLQEIICDADTYHLGTTEFKNTNKRAMEEQKLKTGNLDKNEFNSGTLDMLEHHKFYTSYCKQLLEGDKEKNMKKIKKKLTDPEEENKNAVVTSNEQGENLNNLTKDKTGLMSKGIQTMLRLASENHLKLSEMADHKANILISVNSIIISVILSVLLRKLADEPYLTIPSVIFLAVAVSTIVISILATRPKISGGTFTHEEVLDKKTNLLFFGNFHRASFEEYNVAMRNMMVDTDYLYGSLIKDIYHLGVVLGKKYRLIRLAYNIFMIGIIVSVIAFALAVMLNHSAVPVSTTDASGSPF